MASLPGGEAVSGGQAAGAASPPAQWKLAAHGWHQPLPLRAKPGWQEQGLELSSKQSPWASLMYPALQVQALCDVLPKGECEFGGQAVHGCGRFVSQ